MKCLILSSKADPHATAVFAKLTELGVKPDLFNYEQFSRETKLNLRLGSDDGWQLSLAEGNVLDFAHYYSVWHRRAGAFRSGPFPFPWVRQWVDGEARAAICGAFESLQCLWVNHPSSDARCAYKIHQLKTASRVGLNIPQTLITNDPAQVLAFYEAQGRQVIYKPISETAILALPGFEIPCGVPTLPLRETDLAHLEQVRIGAHLFQNRIVKSYEVRTTIIGRKIFSVRIDSQSGKGSVDWRQDYSVPMVVCELPDDVSEACLNLMREMELNYGALDFCVTEDGEYYFLELNCAGQYLWLEHRTDLKLSKELALLLAGKSQPITAPAMHGHDKQSCAFEGETTK